MMTLRLALSRFQEMNCSDLGAALSYFAVFALVPLLNIVFLIINAAFGADLFKSEFFNAFQNTVGPDAANLLSETLEKANQFGGNVWISIASAAALIVTVVILTADLQSSLDKIFGAAATKQTFFFSLYKKIMSFGMVLVFTILLAIFLLISSVFTFFTRTFEPYVQFSYVYVHIGNFIILLLLIFFFSLLNFRFLPHATLRWKSIIMGSAVTAVLFMIGKLLLNLYISFAHPGLIFGAAGPVFVILIWIFYSAQILFFGASFSYAYEKLSEGDRLH